MYVLMYAKPIQADPKPNTLVPTLGMQDPTPEVQHPRPASQAQNLAP